MTMEEFSYQRPATLDAALDALAAADGSAKVLAGGMSILPLMKLRLAHADTLIDIGRLGELKGARPTADGGFEIGALTTYAETLAATSSTSPATASWASATSRSATAGRSGVRSPTPTPLRTCRRWGSRSTTRSSCARSAASARCLSTASSRGRSRPASNPTRSLSRLKRGPLPAGAKGAYKKMEHPASGYSIVGVCAVVASSGGSITHARVALTGVGEVAYRAKAVEAALLGSDGSPASVAAAAAHATDGVTVNGDIHADREYRTQMAAVYTRRAIEAALGRSA